MTTPITPFNSQHLEAACRVLADTGGVATRDQLVSPLADNRDSSARHWVSPRRIRLPLPRPVITVASVSLITEASLGGSQARGKNAAQLPVTP